MRVTRTQNTSPGWWQVERYPAKGVDLEAVSTVLERQGVEKFVTSWRELAGVAAELLSVLNPEKV
jgi:transaldolase